VGEQPTEEAARLEVYVPPEHEGGVYANVVGVWHSAYEFTLDFCVAQPARREEEAEDSVVIPCRVVSRCAFP
jgi:Protein of unknown function (DUF3467)